MPYIRTPKALVGAQFSVHMDPSKKIESIESEAPSPLRRTGGLSRSRIDVNIAWSSVKK